jgi:uncharacterized membrane protein
VTAVPLSPSFAVNASVAALLVIAVATVIGLVTLWPRGEAIERPETLNRPDTEGARVVGVAEAPCRLPGETHCRRVTVELTSGPEEGTRTQFTIGGRPAERALQVGDRIRVHENRLPEGAQLGGVQIDRYGLADFERRLPLALLALGFGLLVAVTGRWRGVRALLGLLGSLGIVVAFVVPAILHGEPPVTVALVGAFAVMLLTIPLAHGFGLKSVAACLGTAGALILTVLLAEAFTGLARLTGISSDEAVYLQAVGGLSLQGLLLAGMVIGALGVLDDTTVTQSSAVMALRRANPAQRFPELFRNALAIGHDHIAATVNTLVLAYAGASLPVLLIFSLGDVSFLQAVNTEAVAAEVVAMLVGSIGIIAAVPITTALAALLATSTDPEALPDAHPHAH